MRGLKTQEGEKFEKFHALIQQEAKKQQCVWFCFAGEGRDFDQREMEGEDLSGWLVPEEQADKFESFWLKHENWIDFEAWEEFFTWAVWFVENGQIKIRFEKW